MPSLYSLTADIVELEHILEQIEEQGEDWEGSMQDITTFLLEPKEEQLAEKIDNYVSYYRNLTATAEAQRAEGKHLYEMARMTENRAERLKEAAKDASQQLGRNKLQGNTRSITVSESKRPAIEILDIRDIPAMFKEQVWEWKVDKKAITEHVMDTGEIVDGIEVRKVKTVTFR